MKTKKNVLFNMADNDIDDKRKTKTYTLIGVYNGQCACFTKMLYKNQIFTIEQILKGTFEVIVQKKEWLIEISLIKYIFLLFKSYIIQYYKILTK